MSNSKENNSFHRKIIENSIKTAEKILKDPYFSVYIDIADDDGNTPLHLTVRDKEIDFTRLLFNINSRNKAGMTPLHMYVYNQNLRFVHFFKRIEADINAIDNAGNTALHLAVISGNLTIVKYLLVNTKADINAIDNAGNTALHLAVRSENVRVVKYLLDEGAYRNAVNYNDNTPLHLAVSCGDIKLLKLLAELPALDMRNNNGETALHLAVRSENVRVVKYLLDKGAYIFDKNKNYKTVLDLAIISSNIEVLESLLANGGGINVRDEDVKTALELLLIKDNIKIILLLCARNPDLYLKKDSQIFNIISSLKDNQHIEIKRLIKLLSITRESFDPEAKSFRDYEDYKAKIIKEIEEYLKEFLSDPEKKAFQFREMERYILFFLLKQYDIDVKDFAGKVFKLFREVEQKYFREVFKKATDIGDDEVRAKQYVDAIRGMLDPRYYAKIKHIPITEYSVAYAKNPEEFNNNIDNEFQNFLKENPQSISIPEISIFIEEYKRLITEYYKIIKLYNNIRKTGDVLLNEEAAEKSLTEIDGLVEKYQKELLQLDLKFEAYLNTNKSIASNNINTTFKKLLENFRSRSSTSFSLERMRCQLLNPEYNVLEHYVPVTWKEDVDVFESNRKEFSSFFGNILNNDEVGIYSYSGSIYGICSSSWRTDAALVAGVQFENGILDTVRQDKKIKMLKDLELSLKNKIGMNDQKAILERQGNYFSYDDLRKFSLDCDSKECMETLAELDVSFTLIKECLNIYKGNPALAIELTRIIFNPKITPPWGACMSSIVYKYVINFDSYFSVNLSGYRYCKEQEIVPAVANERALGVAIVLSCFRSQMFLLEGEEYRENYVKPFVSIPDPIPDSPECKAIRDFIKKLELELESAKESAKELAKKSAKKSDIELAEQLVQQLAQQLADLKTIWGKHRIDYLSKDAPGSSAVLAADSPSNVSSQNDLTVPTMVTVPLSVSTKTLTALDLG